MRCRCKDCGLLALREYATRRLVEVEPVTRETGEHPPKPLHSQGVRFDRDPVCLAGAIDFGEAMRNTGMEKTSQQIAAVCRVDRDCASFTPWRIGMTPKEHVQMNWEQEQRQWQREVAETNRKWLLRMEKRHRKWRKEDAREGRVTALLAAIAAALMTGVVTHYLSYFEYVR